MTYLLDVNRERILCDIFIRMEKESFLSYLWKLMVRESFVTYLLDVNGERILCDIFMNVNHERILCDIFIRC